MIMYTDCTACMSTVALSKQRALLCCQLNEGEGAIGHKPQPCDL